MQPLELVLALVPSFVHVPAPPLVQGDVVETARALLAEGQQEEALGALEAELATLDAEPEGASVRTSAARRAAVLHALGDAYLALADEWITTGQNPMSLFDDAARSLDRALALAPNDAGILASAYRAAMQVGDYAKASGLARRELGTALLGGDDASADALDRATRADLLRLWQDDPQDPVEFAGRFEEAFDAMSTAVERAPDDARLRIHLADLLQWMRQPSVAARVVLEGLERDLEDEALHRRLIDVHTRDGMVARLAETYARLCAGDGLGANATWFRGYVELLAGDHARKEQRYSDAERNYTTCIDWMARARELAPDYADSCERMSFLAEVGLGWCAMRQREFERASAAYLALLERDPVLHELPGGLGRTLVDAIGILQRELVSARDFGVAIPLARRIAELRPDEASWWNNLGFVLREYASQVECGAIPIPDEYAEGANGDPFLAAKAIFRDSWQAYTRSAALAPDDARLVNDAALIQAYHLRTELPRARAMFHQAIDAGTAALEALGDDPPEDERFPLAQAVGDALENLGFVAYHVDHDMDEATKWFERCDAIQGGYRPVVVAYLEAIRGEREPIADPFSVSRGMVPGPNRDAPARVAWEPSLEDALARAAAERKPIFVYYRGAGVSERAGILDGLMTIPSYVAPLANAVAVVADANRSTHLDRRDDGTRIPSHRHLTVTCAEHIRAAEEFLAWWDEQRTEDDLALPEEGYYYLFPSGERFVPDPASVPSSMDIAAALDAMQAKIVHEGPPEAIDYAAIEGRVRSLRADVREPAVEELVSLRGSAGRDLIESIVFDDDAPIDARRLLVEGMAKRDDADARGLVDALARQSADPALQHMAILACRSPETLDALRHARLWSSNMGNRRAATEVLKRFELDDAEVRLLVAQLIAATPFERAGAATVLGQRASGRAILEARRARETDPLVLETIERALNW